MIKLTLSRPAVIVANHPCMWDFIPILKLLNHQPMIVTKNTIYIRFKKVFRLFGLNLVSNKLGGIRRALKHLKAGGTVLIFPEGMRSFKSDGKIFDGFAWLAQKSGATIYPIKLIRRPFWHHVIIQPSWFANSCSVEGCKTLFRLYCLDKEFNSDVNC